MNRRTSKRWAFEFFMLNGKFVTKEKFDAVC
jgi:hypothetical protein